ncbi:MAG: hypothetical protein V1914_04575 [archaeon]
MVFSFFKRRDSKLEGIHSRLDESFAKIREDMEKVSSWINHFHGKHGDHEKNFESHNKKFENVSSRLSQVEFALAELQTVILNSQEPAKKEEKIIVSEDFREDDSEGEASAWMELTETQQKLCGVIAALQKEMPNEWISLKNLAQEMYPEKEYSSVRSTICQFVSQLEEMGFVKRRRKGRQTYVSSTDKNPYKGKVRAKKVAIKVKSKGKK